MTAPLSEGVAAAVVGAADVDATTAWLGHLGFTEITDLRLSPEAAKALYADGAATHVRELRVPDATRGAVRLVAAAERAQPDPLARGPYGFLLYTRDLHRSLDIAAGDGARPSPVAAYQAGVKQMREARAVYPDGLVVVFVQVDDRRPSLLDDHPDRLHSELHSVTFAVEDVDEAVAALTAAGLSTVLDTEIAEPSVTGFLQLPRPDTRIRLVMLATADQTPARVEVLTYTDAPGPAAPAPGSAVRVGLRAAVAYVGELASVTVGGAALPTLADTGLAATPRCALVDLGRGVSVELWESGP